ncbi:hypothetical protein D7Z26_00265 [Cohnella endophytica]|uniref:Uncharacterized protein n=1 Tax=Cohnella endophytica TaxID=2419778 RepID=A0A494YBG8_9BACL|nr:hypothetical protein D7Z26_00265 [Cohnella endophytica]
MIKLVSFVFELLRLCILLILTLLILGGLEREIYRLIFGNPIYLWSMTLGNMILFLVVYRNYFQFKGWYKSENNKKLKKSSTISLITFSMVLLLIPIWIN